MTPPLAIEAITGRIMLLRGQRVMLDADLAALFGVTTGRLNEAVCRNLARFPADFMFQLTNQELAALRSQISISNTGRGGRRYAPYGYFSEMKANATPFIPSSPRASTRARAGNDYMPSPYPAFGYPWRARKRSRSSTQRSA